MSYFCLFSIKASCLLEPSFLLFQVVAFCNSVGGILKILLLVAVVKSPN